MKPQFITLGAGVLSLSVLIGSTLQPAYAKESDGTAPEITTLNIPSKLPFVDRTQFAIRGEINYTVPQAINDGLEVDDARNYGDLDEIMVFLNEIEEKNQKFRIGKDVQFKKGKGKNRDIFLEN